jgi:hypothetical protein
MFKLKRRSAGDAPALAALLIFVVFALTLVEECDLVHCFKVFSLSSFVFGYLDLGSYAQSSKKLQNIVDCLISSAVVSFSFCALWFDSENEHVLRSTTLQSVTLILVACTYALDFGYLFGSYSTVEPLSTTSIIHHVLGFIGCAWALAHSCLGAVLCRLLLDSTTALIAYAEDVCSESLDIHAPRLFNRLYLSCFVVFRLVFYPIVLSQAIIATAPDVCFEFIGASVDRVHHSENVWICSMLTVWLLFSSTAHVKSFIANGGISQWNYV